MPRCSELATLVVRTAYGGIPESLTTYLCGQHGQGVRRAIATAMKVPPVLDLRALIVMPIDD